MVSVKVITKRATGVIDMKKGTIYGYEVVVDGRVAVFKTRKSEAVSIARKIRKDKKR